MGMEFSYYPGCAGQQIQKEVDISARFVCHALKIKLHDMPAATCCGAVSLRETNPALSLAVVARILTQAEADGRDIVTICNTCLQTMAYTNHRFKNEPELLAKINAILQQAGVRPYQASIEIRHLLWVIVDMVDANFLRTKIVKPLNGLKIAPFYGCHNIRPSWIFATEKTADQADHLDRLIHLLGGEAITYAGKYRCCGFHVMLSDKLEMRRMVTNHCLDAKNNGAELMITPCTLCDMSMNVYQGLFEDNTGQSMSLPEMNFTQLLGLAMGIDKKKLGIQQMYASPENILHSKGVL